jgi:hypothetical protein
MSFCYGLVMAIDQRIAADYPVMWLRWVRQQVSVAVRYELTAANPQPGPHLRGLPLTCGPDQPLDVALLRELIHPEPGRRVDPECREQDPECREHIVDRILADPRIAVAAPDLAVMLAWHLTRYSAAALTAAPLGQDQPEEDTDQDHECFDPEQLADEMVKSGLVAATWTLTQLQQQYDSLLRRAPQRVRRTSTRRGAGPAAPTQLMLPLFA